MKRTAMALPAALLAVSLVFGGYPQTLGATATAYAATDTQSPTAPTNFRTTAVTGTTVSLAWNASTDNVGVTGYDVYKGKTRIATTADTSYTVTGLSPTSKYSFSVRARDAAGNVSSGAYLSVRTTSTTADTTAPTAPANLRSTAVSDTSVSLAWDASTDNNSVASYSVYAGASLIGTVSGTTYTATGLTQATAYTFTVKAKDPAGNISSASNALSVTTNPTPTTSGGTTSAGKVVGYYASWSMYRNFNVTDIDATRVNYVNYAFANVTNGTCAVGDPYADTDKVFPGDSTDPGTLHGNFGQLLKVKQANPNLRTLISVGGWDGSSNFSAAASTDASRAAFAAGCVNFVRQYGFDGLDVDWEYPVSGGKTAGTSADKHNFTLLLQTLRQKFDEAGATDGKRYLLTIAGGAGSAYLSNTEMDLAHPSLDWINIMTYDFTGPWMSTTGFNSPLYGSVSADTSVKNYLAKGVPASKLILGIPFYARGSDNVTNVNNGLNQAYSGLPPGTYDAGVFDYNDLKANYVNVNGYTRYWSDTTKEPWLFNGKVFITYEDPTSIGYKTGYIKSQGLGGAMIWELSNDRGRDLLTAVSTGLQ